MISGLGFSQVAQFQSKPLFKDACTASIYFISPDISSSSFTPSLNLLPHLYSSFTFFHLKSHWSDKNLFTFSFFFPFLSHYCCTSVLSPIEPTLYVLIPLHTDQFVHLGCLGAAQAADSWATDLLLLCFPFPSTQSQVSVSWHQHTKTHMKHSWFMAGVCGLWS